MRQDLVTKAQARIRNVGEKEKKREWGEKILRKENNPKTCCAQHPVEPSKNSSRADILISLLTSERV